jgi:hypothetical protein
MFTFSWGQLNYIADLEKRTGSEINFLTTMILEYFKNLYQKLFYPCNGSGIYIYRDFDD